MNNLLFQADHEHQQQLLQLPDGAPLLLNTRTAINRAFTVQERLIHLHQGELPKALQDANIQAAFEIAAPGWTFERAFPNLGL